MEAYGLSQVSCLYLTQLLLLPSKILGWEHYIQLLGANGSQEEVGRAGLKMALVVCWWEIKRAGHSRVNIQSEL